MKRFSALALALVLWCGLTGGTQETQVLETPFFPLKLGHVWHYRSGNQKVQVKVAKLDILEVKIGGKTEKVPCYRLETTSGERKLSEHVAVQPDGVYRFTAADQEITPPLRFFKLPLEKDQTWECAAVSEGKAIKGKFTSSADQVAVPAGMFQAMKISCPDFQLGDQNMAVTYWFTPNIGIVKQHVKVGSLEVTLELEKTEN